MAVSKKKSPTWKTNLAEWSILNSVEQVILREQIGALHKSCKKVNYHAKKAKESNLRLQRYLSKEMNLFDHIYYFFLFRKHKV